MTVATRVAAAVRGAAHLRLRRNAAKVATAAAAHVVAASELTFELAVTAPGAVTPLRLGQLLQAWTFAWRWIAEAQTTQVPAASTLVFDVFGGGRLQAVLAVRNVQLADRAACLDGGGRPLGVPGILHKWWRCRPALQVAGDPHDSHESLVYGRVADGAANERVHPLLVPGIAAGGRVRVDAAAGEADRCVVVLGQNEQLRATGRGGKHFENTERPVQ
mmetsp:Transcript_20176/g.55874  ORF Transcript_20176/g.55874 Transcript_20176/m.55874 type:complete len:218 (-) Transcript_20176:740-1393(-)